jgi:hypothetical protein
MLTLHALTGSNVAQGLLSKAGGAQQQIRAAKNVILVHIAMTIMLPRVCQGAQGTAPRVPAAPGKYAPRALIPSMAATLKMYSVRPVQLGNILVLKVQTLAPNGQHATSGLAYKPMERMLQTPCVKNASSRMANILMKLAIKPLARQ